MADVERQLQIAILTDTAYPYVVGGKEERHRQAAHCLAAAGADVTIYTMRAWSHKGQALVDGVRHVGICRALPTFSGQSRSLRQAILFSLASMRLARRPFDILEVDSVPLLALFPAYFVAWVRRRTVVLLCHEVLTVERLVGYYGHRKGRVSAAVQRAALRLPVHCIAVSKGTSQRVAAIRGSDRDITTIELAIDAVTLQRVPPTVVDAPDLLCVGHLVPDKRVDLAIRSLRHLHDAGYPLTLMILGNGPQQAELELLAHQLDMGEFVTFQEPWLDKVHMVAVLKAAKVLVAPSSREGFGLTVLEALSVGTPVVMADDDDNLAVDRLAPYHHASVVRPEPASFAQAISRWIGATRHPDRTPGMNRGWADYVSELLVLYSRLIDHR